METTHFRRMLPVPVGYRRLFKFVDPGSGFKQTLLVTRRGVTLRQTGDGCGNGVVNNLSLDWLAESICAVRQEIGDL